ncbi:MAG: hypothetical protein ACXIUW_03495 [Roseinatronobacter sp.]
MRWLLWLLSGPMLWAFAFVLVYGLHGMVCADISGPEGLPWQAQLVLISVWLVSMLAFAPLFLQLSKGTTLSVTLPRAGAWIGLVATAFTLFPVAVTTSC